jgi:hypothetical protein
VQNLAVQIASIDCITVNQPDGTYTGANHVSRCRASKTCTKTGFRSERRTTWGRRTAKAHNEHPSTDDSCLPLNPYVIAQYLAAEVFDLVAA